MVFYDFRWWHTQRPRTRADTGVWWSALGKGCVFGFGVLVKQMKVWFWHGPGAPLCRHVLRCLSSFYLLFVYFCLLFVYLYVLFVYCTFILCLLFVYCGFIVFMLCLFSPLLFVCRSFTIYGFHIVCLLFIYCLFMGFIYLISFLVLFIVCSF